MLAHGIPDLGPALLNPAVLGAHGHGLSGVNDAGLIFGCEGLGFRRAVRSRPCWPRVVSDMCTGLPSGITVHIALQVTYGLLYGDLLL